LDRRSVAAPLDYRAARLPRRSTVASLGCRLSGLPHCSAVALNGCRAAHMPRCSTGPSLGCRTAQPSRHSADWTRSIDCLLKIPHAGKRFLGQSSLPSLVVEVIHERSGIVD
jgi:hypothetical protein